MIHGRLEAEKMPMYSIQVDKPSLRKKFVLVRARTLCIGGLAQEIT